LPASLRWTPGCAPAYNADVGGQAAVGPALRQSNEDHGAVARVDLRYPPAARAEAVKLGDGLRRFSENILVS
jgi:hypothetical protein